MIIPWPGTGVDLRVTEWDAFGYYIYAPSIIIYNDPTQLEWLTKIDDKYHVTGGHLYQADRAQNGNYIFKYSGGIAIMQLPFFILAHFYALIGDYSADGFSKPYQWAIAFSGLIYSILGLFLLRLVLLRWYNEGVTMITLALIVLATNFIQYTSIKGAMSHSYIFFLYACVLYATMKWHEAPRLKWAAMVGYLIGLAIICRPTEIIMLFIPLLWGMSDKSASTAKWTMVRKYRNHVMALLIFCFLGILPQLIYWKFSYGSFIYPMGSKWSFLLPYFEVLFGGNKGWFIYTPITLLFIVGLYFVKSFPFRKSVIAFSILNIWIVCAWSDPSFGASYSARALVQGYAVMALAMAAVVNVILQQKWRWALYVLAGYFILVNLFQLWQYDQGMIRTDQNTFRQYWHVYLNPNPS
ncbi:MAG: hypothetical protein COB85_00900 [Bacteroidetes bacterium]|nr:MAG: hypothetical protein COB85_00900 [Bacteroidota bacterium]